MPVVSQIANVERAKTKTIELEGYPKDPAKPGFGWETSTVTYRPGALSVERDLPTEGEELVVGAIQDDYAFDRRICDLIVEWDFEGPIRQIKDGRAVEVFPAGPIPLEPEIVGLIEFGLKAALYQGIVKAEVGNPRKRRRSS